MLPPRIPPAALPPSKHHSASRARGLAYSRRVRLRLPLDPLVHVPKGRMIRHDRRSMRSAEPIVKARNSSSPRTSRGTGALYGVGGPWARIQLLLFNTTRTTSGPPSTGAAIAMDSCCCCSTRRAHTPDPQALDSCCCCSTRRAHTPDPQAQEPLSLWTEVWPTQPMLTLDVLTPCPLSAARRVDP